MCLVLGCAAPPALDTGHEPVGEVGLAGVKALPDFVARNEAHDLVIAAGLSGATRQSVSMEGRCDDVIWDPWKKTVLVVRGDEDEEDGEIASHAVLPGRRGPELGAPSHVAWLAGRARLLPSPHGTVVFEQSYGERWRLLGSSPSASVGAPPPTSAWLTVRPTGALIHGFDASTLVRREAYVTAAGIAMPAPKALAIPPAMAPDARFAPLPDGEVMVSVSGSSLKARRVHGAAVGPASSVALGAHHGRVEAVVSLRGGVVVALLAEPSALVAFALDGDGVSGADLLPLPGDVAENAPFFSRDLAVQSAGRVLAATSAGLFAARVTDGPSGIHLDLAPGFDGSALRGPIAVLSPAP